MTIWYDLTKIHSKLNAEPEETQFEFDVCKRLVFSLRDIRFCYCIDQRFYEVEPLKVAECSHIKDINFLFDSRKSKRKILNLILRRNGAVEIKKGDYFITNYNIGNEISYSEALKVNGVKLVYIINDLSVCDAQSQPFFRGTEKAEQDKIIRISQIADTIIFTSESLLSNFESFLASKNLQSSVARKVVKFHTSLFPEKGEVQFEVIKKKYNLDGNYLLTIGDFSQMDNFKVLYQACAMIGLEKKTSRQLVVIAIKKDVESELLTAIKLNPLTNKLIKVINVNDHELVPLIENCRCGLVPSLYSGNCKPLRYFLELAKPVFCSDIQPYKEYGLSNERYLKPNSPTEWKEAILASQKVDFDSICSQKCTSEFDNDWSSCLFNDAKSTQTNGKLYYDFTLFFHKGGISGIPRAQLLIGRYLSRLFPDIQFFAFRRGKFIQLDKRDLMNTLSDQPVDIAVQKDKEKLGKYRIWKSTRNIPFCEGDLVFSAGAGYDYRVTESLISLKRKTAYKFVQLIYDYTPVKVPQTHSAAAISWYPIFLRCTQLLSDFIIYGGNTAQKDGIEYQHENKYPVIPSDYVKFGSDFQSKNSKLSLSTVLEKYSIETRYIMTVGTIEARKNQSILYQAYLELLESSSDIPQLLICGRKGWKTEEFRNSLNFDLRVKDKIKLISPSDEELDLLYKNCEFTLLASFYEGWSLTLPESLNYKKFCIATDTPSLKEVGQDLIEYANPYDPQDWARKIRKYSTNKKLLFEREQAIKREWKNVTWKDCGLQVSNILKRVWKSE